MPETLNISLKNVNKPVSFKKPNFKFLRFGLFLLLFIFCSLLFANQVFAQVQPVGQLGLEYGTATGLTTSDIRLVVARIIRAFLGILGIIAVLLVIYGGFLWMTSAGDDEKINRAKQILINSVIGLAIILSAFAITQFIISRFVAATVGLQGGEGGGKGVAQINPLTNALGNGIVREHYPGRDATGIPRNTKAIISFKEPIDPASLIKDYNNNGTADNLTDDQAKLNTNGTPDINDDYMELNTDALKFYASDDGQGSSLISSDVKVNFTQDLKTWVFDPVPLLGSPTEEVWYTSEVSGGRTGPKLTSGEAAFAGVFSNGYTWEFQVSTLVDTTPPKVLSVIPVQETDCEVQEGGACARNIILSVNFSEPVDPTSVSGQVPGFTNVLVDSNGDATGGEVAGSFAISNQYQTVEFTPSEKCGVNSCGNDIFCLPGNADLRITVRAATLSLEAPMAALPYPYDGATDIVGNSLDGNADGSSKGPAEDNYSWVFKTSNVVDTTPPSIYSLSPDANTSNVNANTSLETVFTERMRMSTLSNINMGLEGANQVSNYQYDPKLVPWYAPANSNVYWPSRETILPGVTQPTGNFQTTLSTMQHGTLVVDTSYYPDIRSGVQDLYQNCLFPPNAGVSAPANLKCATTPDRPYCCVGQGGPVSCSVPCTISDSGNPICQE